MHKILVILFIISISAPVYAFQQQDSLKVELDEVVITGYEGYHSILKTSASVSYLNAEEINLFDKSSLLSGLNTKAGVVMEERAPGSYRVSIRGSSLRSPFGVRNIKMYWNGIPFTEPTGSTALNLLDVSNINSIEVIKGPAGSMYGAGNGGVILMNSFVAHPQNNVTFATGMGSFGNMRFAGNYTSQIENGVVQLGYSSQLLDGYRQQNHLKHNNIEVNSRFSASAKSAMQVNMLYSNIDYGIPGGLDADQFETNPKQARPGSVENKSGILQEALLMGVTLNNELAKNITMTNSVFSSLSAFDNPYLLDYKKESRKSGGLRSRLYYDTQVFGLNTALTAGFEFQMGETTAQNYDNNNGKIDGLNFDDEIGISSTLLFGAADIDLKNNWLLTVGLGFNTSKYRFNRLVTQVANDTTGLFETDFKPTLMPRIAINKNIKPNWSIFASAGHGFSPPTVEEVRTNEGSLNLGLDAEKGMNYEVGSRGFFVDNRITFDAVLFYFLLKDAIVQLQTDRGTNIFRNAGSAKHLGFELQTNFTLLKNPTGLFKQLSLQNALTINRFKFDKYDTATGNYSGNKLTGVPPNISATTINLESKVGFYTAVSHYFADKTPLNDSNTVYSRSHNIVKATVGIKSTIKKVLEFDIYLTADNLLNEKYSLGYDINAFGNRFYQPAPPQNWFAGFKLSYNYGSFK